MRAAVLAGLTALLLAAPATAAGAYKAPRTPHGHPDLQGVWNTNFILPLEALPGVTSLTLPQAEAKAYARRIAAEIAAFPAFRLDPEFSDIAEASGENGLGVVRGERRTRQVVQPADGLLPLQPRFRAQARFIEGQLRTNPEPPWPTANPEDRPNWERCVVGQGQPPVTGVSNINPRQIVQTRDHVVILAEYGNDVRIVPFTRQHGGPSHASALGDSIARWEGDTLVVETVGLPAKDAIRPFPTLFVPAKATVVERFTRVSATELLYQYTVVDPGTYAAPWLAEYSLTRTDQRLFEFACHEGNYALPNILAGARERERQPAGR